MHVTSLTSALRMTSMQVLLELFPCKGALVYYTLLILFGLAEQVPTRLTHEGMVNHIYFFKVVFLYCLAKPAHVP